MATKDWIDDYLIDARRSGIALAQSEVCQVIKQALEEACTASDLRCCAVEIADNATTLADAIVATIRDVTKLRGEVAFHSPGALPNDGKVIEDKRRID